MTIPLIFAPQGLTDTWATLGDVVDVRQGVKVGLLLAVTKNDTAAMEVMAKGLIDGDVVEYSLPLYRVRSDNIGVDGEVFEITLAANINLVLKTETEGLLDEVQFYIKADPTGASPASVTSAKVRLVNN